MAGQLFTVSASKLKTIQSTLTEKDVVIIITRSNTLKSTSEKMGWLWDSNLAPSWDLFMDTKLEKEKRQKWDIDDFNEYYVPRFLKELQLPKSIESIKGVSDLIKNGLNVYLVCFCSDPNICHRNLVAMCISSFLGIKAYHVT